MADRATEIKERFAAMLREQADARGLSGADIARKMLEGNDIARKIEAQTRKVNYWLAGRNEPSLTDISKLCQLLHINPATALGLYFSDEEGEFELIEALDVRAAAGAGAVVDEERAKFNLAFRADWLRRVTNAPRNKLKIIEADRDSMEPFIHDGDHLLVDMTQTDPTSGDGIYVLDWRGHLHVKRVTVNPANETISIQSDNPSHADYHGINPDDVRVIGRVIWVGRRT